VRDGTVGCGRDVFSCPYQHHLLVTCYIERNPLYAGLVEHPEEWEWSRARHHLGIVSDPVISKDDLLLKWIDDWSGFLSLPVTEKGAGQDTDVCAYWSAFGG